MSKGVSLKSIVLVALFFAFCWNIAFFLQHPSDKEIEISKDFVELCENENCLNDWSFGWWVTALGGHTESKSGPPSPDYSNSVKPFYALTQQDLNCVLIAGEPLLKLYKCV